MGMTAPMNARTALDATPMPTIMMMGGRSAPGGVALSIRIGSSTAVQPPRHRPRTTLAGTPTSRASPRPLASVRSVTAASRQIVPSAASRAPSRRAPAGEPTKKGSISPVVTASCQRPRKPPTPAAPSSSRLSPRRELLDVAEVKDLLHERAGVGRLEDAALERVVREGFGACQQLVEPGPVLGHRRGSYLAPAP